MNWFFFEGLHFVRIQFKTAQPNVKRQNGDALCAAALDGNSKTKIKIIMKRRNLARNINTKYTDFFSGK